MLFVFHIYRLGTLFMYFFTLSLIRRDHERCMLILQYLSSLTEFTEFTGSLKEFRILNLYYLTLTKEEICSYCRIKLAWTILLV